MGMGQAFTPMRPETIRVMGLNIDQIIALSYLLAMQGFKHPTEWRPDEIKALAHRLPRIDRDIITELQEAAGQAVDLNSVQSLLDRIVYLQRRKAKKPDLSLDVLDAALRSPFVCLDQNSKIVLDPKERKPGRFTYVVSTPGGRGPYDGY